MKEIYQQTVEEVLERVNGKKSGLTSEQVKRSREKCGWNELTEGKKKGILQIFFEGAVYFPTAPFFVLCVQRSWTTLAGESPVTVIASEPCS